jgi:hypothetical protein
MQMVLWKLSFLKPVRVKPTRLILKLPDCLYGDKYDDIN